MWQSDACFHPMTSATMSQNGIPADSILAGRNTVLQEVQVPEKYGEGMNDPHIKLELHQGMNRADKRL